MLLRRVTQLCCFRRYIGKTLLPSRVKKIHLYVPARNRERERDVDFYARTRLLSVHSTRDEARASGFSLHRRNKGAVHIRSTRVAETKGDDALLTPPSIFSLHCRENSLNFRRGGAQVYRARAVAVTATVLPYPKVTASSSSSPRADRIINKTL